MKVKINLLYCLIALFIGLFIILQSKGNGLLLLLLTDILGVIMGIVTLTYSFKNQKKYKGGIIGKSHKHINAAVTLFMGAFIWHILDYRKLLPENSTGIIPQLMVFAGIIFIATATRMYSRAFDKIPFKHLGKNELPNTEKEMLHLNSNKNLEAKNK